MITKRSSIFVVFIIALITMTTLAAFLRTHHFSMEPLGQRSVFMDDICNPPCWFGLTPGESSVEEVMLLIESNTIYRKSPYEFISGEFDANTGYLTNGSINFSFGAWERRDNERSPSQMVIQDGLVDVIRIISTEYIELQHAVDILGMPDRVTFLNAGYWFNVILIYGEPRMKVWFLTGLVTAPDECNLSNIAENTWVDSIYYYSPTAALEPYNLIDFDQPQPTLWAYLAGERDVSLETFESWLNGEVNEECLSAWDNLPSDVILPTIMPTMGITFTPNASATPTDTR